MRAFFTVRIHRRRDARLATWPGLWSYGGWQRLSESRARLADALSEESRCRSSRTVAGSVRFARRLRSQSESGGSNSRLAEGFGRALSAVASSAMTRAWVTKVCAVAAPSFAPPWYESQGGTLDHFLLISQRRRARIGDSSRQPELGGFLSGELARRHLQAGAGLVAQQ